MDVESVLITGANRGIGLEFVQKLVKLAEPPHFIFATYRNESTTQALKEIRDTSKEIQVVLIKMDVTSKDDIKTARQIVENKLGDKGLNLLINNAGFLEKQDFLDIEEDNMLSHFTTNTVGPVMVLKEMLPLLQKSAALKASEMSVSRAAVLNISSLGGSIELLTDQTPVLIVNSILSYRISKAALNMAMRVIALTLKNRGILITNMCPGRVKTKMHSKHGELTPEESVSAMLQTLPQLNESHHGAFLDRNGKTIPF